MRLFTDLTEKKLALRLIGIFFIFYIILFFLGGFVVYEVSLNQTHSFLDAQAGRVKEDVSYANGKWDMQRYNADPNIPGTYPLYMVDTNGFVLDRWKPIHGFIDTSDLKHLLLYQTAQTITTPSNQTWRVLSTPVVKNGQLLGVITVAHYNPQSSDLSRIDGELVGISQVISSKIVFHDDSSISVGGFDIRDISYDISFQVVDRFNQIVTKNNNTNSIDRIPNYIDNSYVGQLLSSPTTRIVNDNETGESFYLLTTPLFDKNHFVVGALVIGRSISSVYDIVRNFLLAEASVGTLLFVLLSLVIYRIIRVSLVRFGVHIPSHTFSHMAFDKKTGIILIDEHEVAIPYATNQYYLCEALFSSPKKRWEIDELLERFGEVEMTNWRKVYDAMNIVNKKVSSFIDTRLIVLKEKTYQINPELLSKLS